MPLIEEAPGCPFSKKSNSLVGAVCPVSGQGAVPVTPAAPATPASVPATSSGSLPAEAGDPPRGCPASRMKAAAGAAPGGCPASRMKAAAGAAPLVCPVTGAVAGESQAVSAVPTIESVTFAFQVSPASVDAYTKACTLDLVSAPPPTYGMLPATQKKSLLFGLLSRLASMEGEILSWDHYLRLGKPLPSTAKTLETIQFPISIQNLSNESVCLTDGFESRDSEGNEIYYNEVSTVIRGAVTQTPALYRPRASFATNVFTIPTTAPEVEVALTVVGDLTGAIAYRLGQSFGALEEAKFSYDAKVASLDKEVLTLKAWTVDHVRYGRVAVFVVATPLDVVVTGCVRCVQ